MSDLSRWPEADALLERALDLPSDERLAFLEREVSDPELRQALAEVLAEDESEDFLEPGGALDRPVFRHLEDRLDTSVPLPENVGPYRILGEIGRGGMARVFLAERVEGGFEQRVALKLIRSEIGHGDRRERFELERQILARLEHPSIARLIDGGATDDGRPFFAMEPIDGEPIERSCKRRGLNLSERIRLFIEVAEAVAYAHRNLVVHRDIKSSNVMVTTEGRVKLLDFGIAKLIEPGPGDPTVSVERPMTPEYASPEQLQGGAVTTASDVYQLGHLLYRLVTDRSPYEGKTTTPSHLHEAILTDTPTLPSRVAEPPLARSLRGDLDAIVMKAMRKEPERRYSTVQELIEDLQAYLDGKPVGARPDSVGYRMRRFVARNRVPVGVAAVAVVGLVVVVALYTVRLAEERDRARREAAESAEIARFLENVFEVPAPLQSFASEMTAKELLDEGALRIELELADQPLVRASLQGVIGSTYRSLTQLDAAEPLLEESLAFFERAGGPVEQIDALVRLAELRTAQNRLDECIELLEKAHRLAVKESGADSTESAVVLYKLADCRAQTMSELDRAEQEFELAFAVLEESLPDKDPELLNALSARSTLRMAQARNELAEEDMTRVLEMIERHYDGRHPLQVEALSVLAGVAGMRGDYARALELRLRTIALWTERYGEDHPFIAADLHGLAVVYAQLGRLDEAEAAYLHAIEVTRKHAPKSAALGYIHYNLGNLYVNKQMADRALAEMHESLRIIETAKGPDGHEVTVPLAGLGNLLTQLGRYDEAEPHIKRAVANREATAGATHPNTARALELLAKLYEKTGRTPEAVEVLERVYAIDSEHYGTEHPGVQRVAGWLAELSRD